MSLSDWKAEASAINLVSLEKKWYETDSYKDVREVDVAEDVLLRRSQWKASRKWISQEAVVTKGPNRNERLIIILYYGRTDDEGNRQHSGIVRITRQPDAFQHCGSPERTAGSPPT